eukprot:2964314-Rhodomonas_salina.1
MQVCPRFAVRASPTPAQFLLRQAPQAARTERPRTGHDGRIDLAPGECTQLASRKPLHFVSPHIVFCAGKCVRLPARSLALSTIMQEGHEAEEKEIPLHERKKAVPQHVQDLLKQHSTVDNPLADENRRTVADFKGLGTEKKRNTVLVKTELYVRGLPFSMSGKELRELFEGFQPKYARVMRHAKYKDRSLGYGFVGFKTEAKAEEVASASPSRSALLGADTADAAARR